MPYVKVPEFKANEEIRSTDFNDAFSNIQEACDKLDGLNFADEALGFDEVPPRVALTIKDHLSVHSQTFSGATIEHGDGLMDPFSDFTFDNYPGPRYAIFVHPKNNNITATNLTGGEKFIIRASCRIHIPDMGARTYYDGVPAVLKVGLFQFPGEDVIANGSINGNTKRIRCTEQHFRLAFSTKVPSASSGSTEAITEDGADGGDGDASILISVRSRTLGSEWEYRDNRGGLPDSPDDDYAAHDPTQRQDKMPMQAHFTYTTCYLYEHPTTGSPDPTQSFGIMCFLSGMSTGISVNDNVAGGKSGCITPKFLPATITDGSLHMYQVRR